MADLQFAVIGIGRFGRHYVRLLQNFSGAKLKTVSSRLSGDPEAIFADPEIDCVVIATPAVTHFTYLKKAIRANKHVLVEKPFVLSISEAEEIKKLLKNRRSVLMISHQYLYNDYIRYLKARLGEGEIGKTKLIQYEHLYPGPVREDVGVFWDAAPHVLSIVDYLFDSPQVVKLRGTVEKKSQSAHDDFVVSEIEFDNGPLLSLELSSIAPQKVRRMVFSGDKGMAIFDDMEEKNKLKFAIEGQKSYAPEIPAIEPLRNQLENFIKCVNEHKPPLTDIEHGLRVTKNLEQIYRNLRDMTA